MSSVAKLLLMCVCWIFELVCVEVFEVQFFYDKYMVVIFMVVLVNVVMVIVRGENVMCCEMCCVLEVVF